MKFASAFSTCLLLAACAADRTPPPVEPASTAETSRVASACPAAAKIDIEIQLPTPGFVPAPPTGVRLSAPQRLRDDMAPYPSASRPCREEGKVGLTFCVNPDGHVDNAQVFSSSGFARLDNAALAWVQADRYTPGTINGAARRYCGMHVEQEFALAEETIEEAALRLDPG